MAILIEVPRQTRGRGPFLARKLGHTRLRNLRRTCLDLRVLIVRHLMLQPRRGCVLDSKAVVAADIVAHNMKMEEVEVAVVWLESRLLDSGRGEGPGLATFVRVKLGNRTSFLPSRFAWALWWKRASCILHLILCYLAVLSAQYWILYFRGIKTHVQYCIPNI